MGFFTKKNKKNKDTNEKPTQKRPDNLGAVQRPSSRKRKSELAKFVKESVPNTAVDTFKSVGLLDVNYEGVPGYLGLLLNVADIGGISKKDKKDPSKGQLLTMMQGGTIQYFASSEMLQDGKILFIPDEETIESLDEFHIVAEAPLTAAVLTEDGELIETENTFTLSDAISVLEDGVKPSTFLGISSDEKVSEIERLANSKSANYQNPPVEDEDNTLYEEDNLSYEPDYSESHNAFDYDDYPDDDYEDSPLDEPYREEDEPYPEEDDSYMEENYSLESLEDIDDEELYTLDEFVGDENPYYDDEDIYEEPQAMDPRRNSSERNPYSEITPIQSEEELDDIVARTFYEPELPLEVSNREFRARFGNSYPFVDFELREETTPFAMELNEMARTFNQELRQTYIQDFQDVERLFLRNLEYGVSRIKDDFSDTDENSSYGQRFADLEDDYNRFLKQDYPNEVEAKKEFIQKAFDKNLEAAGEEGRVRAMAAYKQRYGPRLENELLHVEGEVKSRYELEHRELKASLNENRKKEAKVLMDSFVTVTLESAADSYSARLERLNERYKEMSAEIRNFAERHRKDEISYIDVLREDQERSNKVDILLQQQETKLQSMRADFEREKARYIQEMEDIKRRNDDMLLTKENEYKKLIANVHSDHDKTKEQLEKTLASYSKIDKQKKKEYEARLADAKNESEQWRRQLEFNDLAHRRASRISTGLMVSGLIVALLIGSLVGAVFGSKVINPGVSEATINEMVEEGIQDELIRIESINQND